MDKNTPKTKPQSPIERAKPLLRRFFDRDPRKVAQELLGKLLIRRQGVRIMAGRVVETEAYMGVTDAAAHSAAGITTRNAVLFGPPWIRLRLPDLRESFLPECQLHAGGRCWLRFVPRA